MKPTPIHAYITYVSGRMRHVYFANTKEAEAAYPKYANNKKVRTATCYDGDKNIALWYITHIARKAR